MRDLFAVIRYRRMRGTPLLRAVRIALRVCMN